MPEHPVKIIKASSQSWTTAEGKRRGTKVKALLMGEIDKIKVLSIVFQKQQTTAVVRTTQNQLVIFADFEEGIEFIFEKPTITDKENMVIYSYKGKIYELPLEDIESKPTEYYPVK